MGGRIVYFCHDSDHDYRETTPPLRDLKTGELKRVNSAADFCLEMYRRLGLLEGIEVVRSGDPAVHRLLLNWGGGAGVPSGRLILTAPRWVIRIGRELARSPPAVP